MPSKSPPPRSVVGEVIAIGDELTTGYRLDTNTQWLSQRLTEQGVLVRFHTTVADDFDAIAAVFAAAARRADVVVATGGLGPTADDLTRDAMAAAAGVELEERGELVAHLEAMFAARGRTMPPQNRRQAQLPAGAAAIANPGGTAPGVDQTVGRCRLFALPGVPAEMRDMYAATVAQAVAELVGETRLTRHWLVRCFGAGESHVESLIPDLIARGREPLVGITASKGTISLRVIASGASDEACWDAMRPTLEEIRAKLGELIFAEHAGDQPAIGLHDAVVSLLARRSERVGSVEAMTSGLLASLLGEADDGRGVVQRCEYAAIEEGEVISDESIEEIAKGLADRFGSGVVVGPRSVDDAARVTVAAAYAGRSVSRAIQLVGHPSIHRHYVAKQALNLLRLALISQQP